MLRQRFGSLRLWEWLWRSCFDRGRHGRASFRHCALGCKRDISLRRCVEPAFATQAEAFYFSDMPTEPLLTTLPQELPTKLLVLMLLLPLLPLLLQRLLPVGRKLQQGVALLAAGGVLLLAMGLGLAVRGPLPQVWTQPLWSMLHVGALRIEVGLQLDFVAAVLLLFLTLLTLVTLRALRLVRDALLLLGLSAAVLLVDNLACVWLLWSLQTLLVARIAPAWPALLLRRVSELLLFLFVALLFWGLGGSWATSQFGPRYQVDSDPARALPSVMVQDERLGQSLLQSLTLAPTLQQRELTAQLQLHDRAGRAPVRDALQSKLLFGGRLWQRLRALLWAVLLLRMAAGFLGVAWARSAARSLRLWLLASDLAAAAHLLWRLS